MSREAFGWTYFRSCPGCRAELEEWRSPLAVGDYVGCETCDVLYRAIEIGLERVELAQEPPDLRRLFEGLFGVPLSVHERAA